MQLIQRDLKDRSLNCITVMATLSQHFTNSTIGIDQYLRSTSMDISFQRIRQPSSFSFHCTQLDRTYTEPARIPVSRVNITCSVYMSCRSTSNCILITIFQPHAIIIFILHWRSRRTAPLQVRNTLITHGKTSMSTVQLKLLGVLLNGDPRVYLK